MSREARDRMIKQLRDAGASSTVAREKANQAARRAELRDRGASAGEAKRQERSERRDK